MWLHRFHCWLFLFGVLSVYLVSGSLLLVVDHPAMLHVQEYERQQSRLDKQGRKAGGSSQSHMAASQSSRVEMVSKPM